jgi:CRISPR-associated protein Csd1
MILQALNEYYERKAAEPGSGMPPYGYGEQKISFCLVISKKGELVKVVDLRQGEGKRIRPSVLTVPAAVIRTGNPIPNFLWDNTGFVLGDGDPEKLKKDPQRFNRYFEEFKKLHQRFANRTTDEGITALIHFLNNWLPSQAKSLSGWEDIQDSNVVFRLEGEDGYLHERSKLHDLWIDAYSDNPGALFGFCLVSGLKAPIADLHPTIKGVYGAQSSGASLVSFNKTAFTSYGKEQSLNAPVSERTAFAYTTGLNFLLRKGSRQRIQLGDATVVFWAERSTPAENLLAALFDPPAKKVDETSESSPEEDQATTALVHEVLSAAKAGRLIGTVDSGLDPDIRFYILGLSPNNARLAVRFWNVSTFGQLIDRVGRHFRDMEIERQSKGDPEYPSFWRVLLETAPLIMKGNVPLRKKENVPPLLAGAVTRAILTGSPYPRILFTAILGRIRSDRVVNYLRAAILKACLIRNYKKEVPMSLDTEKKNPAYRLGRLFALLEKAQKDAINPTATIRDRYFGAASATPAAVFPQLLRLGQHHLSKAECGEYIDRLISEVMDGVDVLPKHLSLEEQGLFTIGYYHQRNKPPFRKEKKE